MKQPLERLKRSWLDRALFGFLTRRWQIDNIAAYRDNLRRHNTAVAEDVAGIFDQVDGKATGLLTHVSLMIAGLGLIAPLVVDNDVEMGIVIAEIAVYLLIAVGCLRCLSVFHVSEFANQRVPIQEVVEHELIIRRELYSLCIRAAIIFTMIVFVVLPILYFWKPEKQ